MKELAQVVLPELDRTEMFEAVGGDDHAGSTFATRVGYAIGWVAGWAVDLVIGDRAPSDYAYAKVGYGS